MSSSPAASPAPSSPRGFAKPALSVAELIGHLEARGLTVTDRPRVEAALRTVGYFRLLPYMRPLQDGSPDKRFRAGTTFADALRLYDFDRELRLLCLDAIERVEVALRAAIIDELGVTLGAHFHADARHFCDVRAFGECLANAQEAKSPATLHYRATYDTPSVPPIWVTVEAITFGDLSHLYAALTQPHRAVVAKRFGYDESILVQWFKSLNYLRNVCAHHGRLWNARLKVNEPKRAKKLREELTRPDTFYARAVVLQALLHQVEPQTTWPQRLQGLLGRYATSVAPGAMGFTAGWVTRAPWL